MWRQACFVTGHDFSRATNTAKYAMGFSPCGFVLTDLACDLHSLRGLRLQEPAQPMARRRPWLRVAFARYT
jgi:hypothetical protein